jgi:hypothetical protein
MKDMFGIDIRTFVSFRGNCCRPFRAPPPSLANALSGLQWQSEPIFNGNLDSIIISYFVCSRPGKSSTRLSAQASRDRNDDVGHVTGFYATFRNEEQAKKEKI